METVDFDFEEDNEPKDEATLTRLSSLAQEARELEMEIEAKELVLAERRGRLDKILRDRIPTIMDELAMESYKMRDGAEVKVKDEIKCGITEERKPQAWKWLEENDYDGIIKTVVSVSFGKGEMTKAQEAVEALKEIGFDAELGRNVHPSTLKSFVKERLEEGDNIPIETFGVFQYRLAKITLPRTRK